jgi:hypothetical protein
VAEAGRVQAWGVDIFAGAWRRGVHGGCTAVGGAGAWRIVAGAAVGIERGRAGREMTLWEGQAHGRMRSGHGESATNLWRGVSIGVGGVWVLEACTTHPSSVVADEAVVGDGDVCGAIHK